MRISDWSSDVCSSDLPGRSVGLPPGRHESVPPRPDVPAGQGNPAHRGRGNGADLPPSGEAGGGRAGELRHPVGDPAAIRVCRPAIRNLPARMELAGLRETARGVARRSEEHTSELQSLMRISYAVFCLKKK